MTKVNYNNGKIYKIEALNGEEGDIYIGSTTKQYLSQRMTAHRNDYNKWKQGKHNKVTSYDLFEKYGINNCEIILLENCPCDSKDQLHARESHYIKTLDCINKCIPGRTKKEWEEDNKDKRAEQNKQYREANRDKILEGKKQYREANKDKIKQYREANREQVLEQRKQKITCDCGSIHRRDDKSKHLKSKKHQAYVASLIPQAEITL